MSFTFSGWVTNQAIVGEEFVRQSFKGSNDVGNKIQRCAFKRCNFGDFVLGQEGSVYRDCKFIDCSFKDATFIRPEFNSCEFINCKFNGCDFRGSSFERCKFVGKIDTAWFRGGFPLKAHEERWGKPKKNEMKDVDFSEAVLISPMFTNHCDLSTVKLPKDGSVIFVDDWHRRVCEGLDAIGFDDKSSEYILLKCAKVHSVTQDHALIVMGDLIRTDKISDPSRLFKLLGIKRA